LGRKDIEKGERKVKSKNAGSQRKIQKQKVKNRGFHHLSN
jgi:hypothetical protein